MIKKEIIIGIIIVLFIIGIIIYLKEREKFENIKPTVMVKPTTSSFFPSYWYKYDTSDTRSKCFDCDATSKYKHGVPCFDCEIPGGRSIDQNLNRVLTR
jgi:hypothetical protein